ncbi:MAG: aminoacyl-tRNA hydrolase [Gammaproteobacteria bacterium]
MPAALKLIVGLGNPGPEYTETRHNAGFWFADRLASQYQTGFSPEKKFHGETARLVSGETDSRLLKPAIFMNRSGQAVQAISEYYRVKPEEMLIVHDEIDLPPGVVRLKKGGGHGGHNGLRDIIEKTGNGDFLRLRLGVGHPGHKDDVVNYVLRRPSAEEKKLMDDAITRALDIMPLVLNGELNKAMTLLNVKCEG